MPSNKGMARGVVVIANSSDGENSSGGLPAGEAGRPSTNSTTRITRSSTRAECTAKLRAPQHIVDLEEDTSEGSGLAEEDEDVSEEEDNNEDDEEDDEEWGDYHDWGPDSGFEDENTLVENGSGEEHGSDNGDATLVEGLDGDEDEYCDSVVDESDDGGEVADVELNDEDVEALNQAGVLVEDEERDVDISDSNLERFDERFRFILEGMLDESVSLRLEDSDWGKASLSKGSKRFLNKMSDNRDWLFEKLTEAIALSVTMVLGQESWTPEDLLSLPGVSVDERCPGVYLDH